VVAGKKKQNADPPQKVIGAHPNSVMELTSLKLVYTKRVNSASGPMEELTHELI